VPFVDRDVSIDHAAGQEMVRRSGQMGVPVITVGDEVIVGFDRRRLEQALARAGTAPASGEGPKLGLRVRDVRGAVEVGGARPGSLGERAGVRAGDVVESLNGQAIRSVADLERMAGTLSSGKNAEIVVRRGGRLLRLVMSNE
jgi:S1-C subfamily serine protease